MRRSVVHAGVIRATGSGIFSAAVPVEFVLVSCSIAPLIRRQTAAPASSPLVASSSACLSLWGLSLGSVSLKHEIGDAPDVDLRYHAGQDNPACVSNRLTDGDGLRPGPFNPNSTEHDRHPQDADRYPIRTRRSGRVGSSNLNQSPELSQHLGR
jgi:hypothetical protein